MAAFANLKRWKKIFKYSLRSKFIGIDANIYWKFYEWRGGLKEDYLALLPLFTGNGRTAIDAGANFGIYTWHISKYFDYCHAFEPNPHLSAVLQKGFDARFPGVVIHQVALSNRADSTILRIPPLNIGYSTIEPSNELVGKVSQLEPIDEVEVECKLLDAYEFEDVGFIKVDVEGHEIEVLEGAEQTIKYSLPSILVEAEERHRAGSVESVLKYLRPLGYHRFILDENRRLVEVEQLPRDVPRNFLFLQPTVAKEIYAKLKHGIP